MKSKFKSIIHTANNLATEVEKMLTGKNNKTSLTLALNSFRLSQVEEQEVLKLINEEFRIDRNLKLN